MRKSKVKLFKKLFRETAGTPTKKEFKALKKNYNNLDKNNKQSKLIEEVFNLQQEKVKERLRKNKK